MDTEVLTTLISGICSIVSAFGSIYLRVVLKRRGQHQSQPPKTIEQEPEADKPSHLSSSYTRPLLIVAGAWVLGNISRALRPVMYADGIHYEALLALLILVVVSCWLAFYHGRSRVPKRQLSYQLEVFALWAGYASGWSMIHGAVWSDLVAVSFAWWLGCAVVGGIVVHLVSKKVTL